MSGSAQLVEGPSGSRYVVGHEPKRSMAVEAEVALMAAMSSGRNARARITVGAGRNDLGGQWRCRPWV